MAGDFLRSHGIDIDAEMHRIQHGEDDPAAPQDEQRINRITNVSLPNTPPRSRWDITFATNGQVSSTKPHDTTHSHNDAHSINAQTALLAPSLCHPHIHLDKAYLLSHPAYAHLLITRGDFAEAMDLTTQAKALFTPADLLERGQRVIDESLAAGVTHMRAFVEVDAGVGRKCLDAGVQLRRGAEVRGCEVQICAFAQLPLFSPAADDPEGTVIRGLMEAAAGMSEEVECIGSTPYVETSRDRMERNVDYMVSLSARQGLHLDFHLDYTLDPSTEPLIWHVLASLKKHAWHAATAAKQRTVVLGHCTRLTLWPEPEWRRLKTAIGDLPIHFVGLPTSDLYMMRTPERTRGTLDVPRMIQTYGLNACLGMNNIGNAFTPHGSCDPLALACQGVGVFSAGTVRDAECLYECVSTRAKAAIGDGCQTDVAASADVTGLEVKAGGKEFVLFEAEREAWRTRRSVAEAVWLYDHCRGRRVF